MKMKKTLALVLAVVMVLAMTTPAMADGADDGSITVLNAAKDAEYAILRLFDLAYTEIRDGEGRVVKTLASYTFTTDGADGGAKELFLRALRNGAVTEAGNTIPSPFTLTRIGDSMTYTVEAADENVSGAAVSEFLNAVLTEVGADGVRRWKEPFTAGRTKKADGSQTVRFDALPYGYYYILSSLGSAVTVDSTMKAVSVLDKNRKPTAFRKKIVGENGTETAYNTASIGDTVTYRIALTGTVYEGERYVEKYYVYDDISDGLIIDPDSVTVSVDGRALEAWSETNPGGAFGIAFGKTVNGRVYDLVIELPWAKEHEITAEEDAANAGRKLVVPLYGSAESEVIVSYQALVSDRVSTTEANPNAATFTGVTRELPPIPENPPEEPPVEPPYDGDEMPLTEIPAPEQEEKRTYTFVGQLVIHKTDPSGAPLSGAKFRVEGEGQNITLVNGADYVPRDADYFAAEASEDAVETELRDGTAYPVCYWLLKTGEYTRNAPVLTENYDTPWTANSAATAYLRDESGAWRPATDAELREYAESGTLFVKTLPNAALYDDTSERYARFERVTWENREGGRTANAGISPIDGVLSFTGLMAGNYTVTESAAPEGYNRLTRPIYVKLVLEGRDGASDRDTADLEKVTDLSTLRLKVYRTDERFEILREDGAEAANGSLTVVNSQGTELPDTGGTGTTLFLLLGAVLSVGAGVFFVTHRRMRKEGF